MCEYSKEEIVKRVIDEVLNVFAYIHKRHRWMFECSYHETTIVDALHHYFSRTDFCRGLEQDGIKCCNELSRSKTGNKLDPTDPNKTRTIRIDFCLHKPDHDDRNILVIEFKKRDKNGRIDAGRLKRDENKVKELSLPEDNSGYVRNYWCGISAIIDKDMVDFKCYTRGFVDSELTKTYQYRNGRFALSEKFKRATDD